MITLFKKASVKWTVVALILTLSAGCSSLTSPTNPSSSTSPANPTSQNTNTALTTHQDDSQKAPLSTVYKNTQYGFNFPLPESWKGYTIVTAKWEGSVPTDSDGVKTAETGPMISIRHPLWTSENPRQDIPIMIFTLTQWNSIQHEKFHIGAAPIGPRELGRNSRYVFALPARYNFAFPTGFEEVQTILDSNPLQPTENNSADIQ